MKTPQARHSRRSQLSRFFRSRGGRHFPHHADGHYLAVNQALAEIYGYASPEDLMSRLTDIGVQLYADKGRRDEFRDLMQANDRVTDFVSEIYQRAGRRIWISENARAVRDWSGALLLL